MKKRTITLMLSLLAVMMLVGVGFATWVISQGTSVDDSGTIVVETVSDERLNLVVVNANSNKEFAFGAPAVASQNIASHWLTSDNLISDLAKPENLTVSFQVKATKVNGAAFKQLTDVTFSGTLTSSFAGFDGKFLSSLGAEGLAGVVSVANAWEDESTKTAIIATVSFTVSWGSLFNSQNPYTYFNTGHKADDAIGDLYTSVNTALGVNTFTATSTYADFALAALEHFYGLTEKTFNVTLKADVQ